MKQTKKSSAFRLKWTLKIKFITLFTLLIIGIMALNGMFIIIREQRLLMDKSISESTALVKSLAIPITNVFLYREIGLLHEEELLDNYIFQLMDEKWPIVFAIILDNQNRVVVHSDLREFGKYYSDPISLNAQQAWETLTQQYSHAQWNEVLEISSPLAISSKRWGTLRVGFSLASIRRRMRMLVFEIMGVTLGLVLLTVLLANFMAKRLTAPLAILTNAMENMSIDRSPSPLNLKSSDEIGYLGRVFREMQVRLFKSHEELQQAQTQILQAEKLASLGRLISGVAHEINNPLSGMQNCIQMIHEEPDNKPQTSKYLTLISEGLSQIKSIISKLLDYARQNPIVREPVNINTAIEKMLALLDTRFNRQRVFVRTNLTAQPNQVWGDRHQLEQVLLNLLINGIDAMPQGGKLTITTRNTTRQHTPGLLIKIADTGTGISRTEIPKIFDPFFTTKDVGEGTGLGLSVCLGIIQTHFGQIDVSSEVGEGTVFSIFLPESEDVAA